MVESYICIHIYIVKLTLPKYPFVYIHTHTHKFESVKMEIKLNNVRIQQSRHTAALMIDK